MSTTVNSYNYTRKQQRAHTAQKTIKTPGSLTKHYYIYIAKSTINNMQIK